MKLIIVLLLIFALSCIEAKRGPKKNPAIKENDYTGTSGGKTTDGGNKKGSGGKDGGDDKDGGDNKGSGGKNGGYSGKDGKDGGDNKGNGGKDGGYSGDGKDGGDNKGNGGKDGGYDGGKDGSDKKHKGKGDNDDGGKDGGYSGDGKDGGDNKGNGGKDGGYDGGKDGGDKKHKGKGDNDDDKKKKGKGDHNDGHGDHDDGHGNNGHHHHGDHEDGGDHKKKKKHHGDHDDKYKHKDHDFEKWCDEHDQPEPEPPISTGSISPLEPPPSPCAKKRCNVGQHCIVDSTGTAQCVAPCYYEGLTYDHGMTFPAGDTCNNNCTCDNGAVTCTEEICTDCVYYFAADEDKEFPATYSSGETWVDECNTCSCDNTVYMCEQKVCGGPCTDEDGNTHEHDSEWVSSDGCNTCECTDGEIDCTEEECIVCWYNNIPHQPGDGWQDGCISCSCDETGATKCTDTCVCKSNDDCEEGYFCDIPSCEDTTGACYECTEENSCLSVPVCGCDGNNYAHSLEATDNHVIVRSYGQCPECSPDCAYGEVCCEGCFGAHNCVKLLAGQPCPDLNCGYGYGY